MDTVLIVTSVAKGLFRCQTRLAVDKLSSIRITASPGLSDAANSNNQMLLIPLISTFFRKAAIFCGTGTNEITRPRDPTRFARDRDTYPGSRRCHRQCLPP